MTGTVGTGTVETGAAGTVAAAARRRLRAGKWMRLAVLTLAAVMSHALTPAAISPAAAQTLIPPNQGAESGKPETAKPQATAKPAVKPGEQKPEHRQRLPKGDHQSPPTRPVPDDKPAAEKKAGEKKPDAKPADPKKPDPKKNDQKKSDPKKADPKATAVKGKAPVGATNEDEDDSEDDGPDLPESSAQPSDLPPAEPVKPKERVKKGVPPPTGLPVPRFVTLRSAEVNVRSGPGRSYPTEWVFTHKEMPVEITAEFDTWRRIRDWEGSTGWVHQSMLSGKRGVRVKVPMVNLRKEPSDAAATVAYAKVGVMGKLLKCKDQWCYVDFRGNRGWLNRKDVWGIYPDEKIE